MQWVWCHADQCVKWPDECVTCNAVVSLQGWWAPQWISLILRVPCHQSARPQSSALSSELHAHKLSTWGLGAREAQQRLLPEQLKWRASRGGCPSSTGFLFSKPSQQNKTLASQEPKWQCHPALVSPGISCSWWGMEGVEWFGWRGSDPGLRV